MEVAGNRIHGTTQVAPLVRFAETEQVLLKPLPISPPEQARWAKAKVHSDCHIQVDKCRYSVPYQRVGQSVDVRLSETTTRIYRNHRLIATHARLTQPGQRSTLDEHLPPEHIAFKMRSPAWCLKQAEAVGPDCLALVNELFADGVVQRLRAAQGIIRLRKPYTDVRLNAACHRALAFGNVGYRSVRMILEKGLDQVVDEHGAFDELCSAYTGGARFGRNTKDLFEPH